MCKGIPLKCADCEAEAVGGGKGDGDVVNFHAYAGEHGDGIVFTCGNSNLFDGVNENINGDAAGFCGEVGEVGVVLHGHSGESKSGVSAGNVEFCAVNINSCSVFGQGAGDVGEKFAGYNDAAVINDFCGDGDFGGDFVVESVDGESLVVSGKKNTSKDRF